MVSAEFHRSGNTKGAFTGPFSEKPQLKNWQKFVLLPPTAPVRDTAAFLTLFRPNAIMRTMK